MKLIKNKTKLKLTHVPTGEVKEGVFMYYDGDDLHIRTKDCPADLEGSDFGLFGYGIEIGEWTVEVVK